MRNAPELRSAIIDLLNQLEAIGIYIPGEDEGQWTDAAGLSFARIEAALKASQLKPTETVT
jgi:hypothetical protein